jgi:predicted dehydrogenase
LIGAGGVSEFHLRAYAEAGFQVVAIADHGLARAKARRDAFFPGAVVSTDGRELIHREDITVLDITPHPADRIPLVREALQAGKHVLSQKPFVLDLREGEELVSLAQANGVRLAVNQNGRYAPHFHYLRRAVTAGLIGEVLSVDFTVQWDHTWVAGIGRFESIHHLILFDFAIHWFDIATCLLRPHRAVSVSATVGEFPGQRFRPPALASVVIQYPAAQVRMSFNAHTTCGEEDVTTVVGSHGTLRSRGANLNEQRAIELYLPNGRARIPLEGQWLREGFQGTMGELLRAIEEKREPENSAQDNLSALELCFAAQRSADLAGVPVTLS